VAERNSVEGKGACSSRVTCSFRHMCSFLLVLQANALHVPMRATVTRWLGGRQARPQCRTSAQHSRDVFIRTRVARADTLERLTLISLISLVSGKRVSRGAPGEPRLRPVFIRARFPSGQSKPASAKSNGHICRGNEHE
jgi:hypothetical protein